MSQKPMSDSNPVVISYDQSAVAVSAASGAIASGAIASGAVASGAVASGAFASGSIASGAIAAGAIAAGATSIADNEDVASANADRGVKVLVVRKATPANTSDTDGDYEFLQLTQGRLWTVAAQQAIIAAGATITRPADITAYASGDLLANSVTAGSVVISTFTNTARMSGGSGRVMGVRMMKSTNSVTNAAFRLHLFTVIPTVVTNGDNSPISGNIVATGKGYLGYVDITSMTSFSDVAWGYGAPNDALKALPFVAVAADIYGLWEVRGAYTPGSAEVFTFAIIVDQD